MVDHSDSDRTRRWLWGLSATLLVGLSITVAILSASQIESVGVVLLPRENFRSVLAAMVGLVVLFVLYGTWQHGRIVARDEELQLLAARESTLRARLGELAALLEMSSQLAQKLDIRAVLRLTASRLASSLEADVSVVHLFSPRTLVLEEVVSIGKKARAADAARIQANDGLLGYVYSSREVLIVDSEEMRSRLATELGLAEPLGAALCAPIRFEGNQLGVLSIVRLAGGAPFPAIHARALQALADHCGAAIFKEFHSQRVARRAA
jgi:transcriptional regulator with GAF, ATPase, and Fis domain